MKYILSIVIPIHNASKYLDNLLCSVKRQMNEAIELILIDDGSEDDSYEKCIQYFENENNVKIIKQENHGVSFTRNKGIDISNGEYLAFVDSDDMISDNYIQKILECLQEDIDILFFTTSMVCEGKEGVILQLENGIYTINEFASTKYFLHYSFLNSLWSKVFKRKTIDTTRFIEKLSIVEDELFIIDVLKRTEQLRTINVVLYQYQNDYSSLSKNINLDLFDFEYYAYDKLKQIMDKQKFQNKNDRLFSYAFMKYLYLSEKIQEFKLTKELKWSYYKKNLLLVKSVEKSKLNRLEFRIIYRILNSRFYKVNYYITLFVVKLFNFIK